MYLAQLTDGQLDGILSLDIESKRKFINILIEKHYPNQVNDEKAMSELSEAYFASIYAEKIYRSNRFFKENFTIIYTDTGLIRNIISDMYFCDDDLITH